ncbi:MAG: phage major capsid protein [Acetobacteraceae bacterium]|nr:phage major capsid protein [Acetobacteraceae bacterium]
MRDPQQTAAGHRQQRREAPHPPDGYAPPSPSPSPVGCGPCRRPEAAGGRRGAPLPPAAPAPDRRDDGRSFNGERDVSVRNLLERRAAIAAEMRGILDKPAGENGDLSAEQEQRFNALKGEADALEQRIQRQAAVDDLERRMAGQPMGGTGDRHLDRELQQVGVLDVIRAALGGTDRNAGLARELSNELERRSGRRAQGLFWRPPPAPEVRVLTSASGGTSLVPTEHRPDLYIAALTASSVVRSLGARVISGLTGNLSIPRETDSPAVGWVAENAALNLGGGAEHGLIYGDWSELLIGVWSELDILVNPYESTAYSKGNVVIRAMATVDVAVRHPKAFVSVEDVTTSTPAMPAEAEEAA